MIDAATFAHSYNGFWHVSAPTCEHFVRRLNVTEVERFLAPMEGVQTDNRAVISEFGFSLYVELTRDGVTSLGGAPAEELLDRGWREAEMRLRSYARQGLRIERSKEEEELQEVCEIANRLRIFFGSDTRGIELRPIFKGCGFIDASEGDVVDKATIYEIKNVNRQLRSDDVRQVVTYAALNAAAEQYEITHVGIVNPRRGQYWRAELDFVSQEMSGMSAQSLLDTIIYAISSGEISR